MRTRGFRTALAAALAAVLLAACAGDDGDDGGYANVGDDPAETTPADDPDEADEADEPDADEPDEGDEPAEADDAQEAFAALSDEAREALARTGLVPWSDTDSDNRHRVFMEDVIERRSSMSEIDLPALWDRVLTETLWNPEHEHFVENLGPAEGGLWLRDPDDPTSGRHLHGFEFGNLDDRGVGLMVIATGFDVSEAELEERLQTWVWTYQIDPRTGEIVDVLDGGEPFVNDPLLSRDDAGARWEAHYDDRFEPLDGLGDDWEY
jgi:hypothetical protein